MVPVLTGLFVAHSRAEEAEVYPVASSDAGESDQVAHSQEEHVEEEESSVVPGMRSKLSDGRRTELGKVFAASRETHLGDQPAQATR